LDGRKSGNPHTVYSTVSIPRLYFRQQTIHLNWHDRECAGDGLTNYRKIVDRKIAMPDSALIFLTTTFHGISGHAWRL